MLRRVVGVLVLVIALGLLIDRLPRPQERPISRDTWDEVSLPFHLFELSLRQPDAKLLMPLHRVRVRQIANTWMAPRTPHRRHEGQDIFAPRGTPVYSATDGVVVRITDHTLGGNSVFVAGAGGRTYFYTHLDRYAPGLEVGEKVTPQTVIGYVGNSGNAKTTPPHLHFGVYGPEGAMNPLPLLTDAD